MDELPGFYNTARDIMAAPEPGLALPSFRDTSKQDFIAFAADAPTSDAIRVALAPSFPVGVPLQQATFQEALGILRNIATPKTILVDLSGEDQPLTAMVDLEAVVEPGTRVLALGSRTDVGFYRSLTRGLGVKEYLPKPATPEAIAREFLPWALGSTPKVNAARGGMIVTVQGICGGIGASTLAVNLAWLLGAELRRHTVLLDTDLHTGATALLLNSRPSPGLRTALEAPDRIDPLLIERAAQPIAERLHVLAAEEPLNEKYSYVAGAAAALETTLRARYNFIVVDIPLRPLPFPIEMQAAADFQVFVLTPTAAAIRAMKRRLANSSNRPYGFRPILVVSYAGSTDELSKAAIEQDLSMPVVATIPDLPREARRSANFGQVLVARNCRLRKALVTVATAIGAISSGATR